MPVRPSRRTVLVAAALIPASAVAGCSLSDPSPGGRTAARQDGQADGQPDGPPDPDPDVALLAEATVATEALVRLYREVSRRHGGLQRDLRPLLRAHRAHARALGDAAPPGGDVGAPRTGAVERVPNAPARAVRVLRRAEQESADALLGRAVRAQSGTFARLLASMAAASAQHVVVLDKVQAG